MGTELPTWCVIKKNVKGKQAWYLKYKTDTNTYKRVSLGYKVEDITEKRIQTVALEKMNDLVQNKDKEIVPTIQDMHKEFKKLSQFRRARSVDREYKIVMTLEKFIAWCEEDYPGVKTIADVDSNAARAYLQYLIDLGFMANTQKSHMVILSSCFKDFSSVYKSVSNPFIVLSKLEVADACTKRELSQEEFDKIMYTLQELIEMPEADKHRGNWKSLLHGDKEAFIQLDVILRLLWKGGNRGKAVRDIKMEYIVPEQDLVALLEGKTKKWSFIDVAGCDWFWDYVEHMKDSGSEYLFPRLNSTAQTSIAGNCISLFKKAGVEGASLHCFRVSKSMREFKMGGLEAASKALQHGDSSVTAAHYITANLSDFAKDFRRREGVNVQEAMTVMGKLSREEQLQVIEQLAISDKEDTVG